MKIINVKCTNCGQRAWAPDFTEPELSEVGRENPDIIARLRAYDARPALPYARIVHISFTERHGRAVKAAFIGLALGVLMATVFIQARCEQHAVARHADVARAVVMLDDCLRSRDIRHTCMDDLVLYLSGPEQ